ncbi:hypothetical protein [Micromonospora avicenniae]|uniref:Uncharacterized protein n=1 Tax=Micromonospora avicenniae TaxID=1198245 RepID=A0A1N6TQN8_9ACTN|nr:hypothetical protein [Micromonospora avicenniae]SIQ55702.1 hypothetical protein SAMN05444858_10366 [Micromonospora avicenniae]
MQCDDPVRPIRSLVEGRTTRNVGHVDVWILGCHPRQPDAEPDVNLGGDEATTMTGPVVGNIHFEAAVTACALAEDDTVTVCRTRGCRQGSQPLFNSLRGQGRIGEHDGSRVPGESGARSHRLGRFRRRLPLRIQTTAGQAK